MVSTRAQKRRKDSLTLNDLISFGKASGVEILPKDTNKCGNRIPSKINNKENIPITENQTNKDVLNLDEDYIKQKKIDNYKKIIVNKKEKRIRFLKAKLSNAYQHLSLRSETTIRIKKHNLPGKLNKLSLRLLNSTRTDTLDRENITHKRNLKLAQQKILYLEKALVEKHIECKRLRDTIQELRGTIRVTVRIKPVDHADRCLAVDSLTEGITLFERKRSRTRNHSFAFNRVFDEQTTQAEIYNETLPLVERVFDGYNVCLLSYGQTGSGKTYTINGELNLESEERGITLRTIETIKKISEKLNLQGSQVTQNISILEIYNDTCRNLLVDDGSKQDKNITLDVSNMNCIQIFNVVKNANKKRVKASTNMNAESSRSHLICTIQVEVESKVETIQGSISICDLAGSERLKRSGSARTSETCSINKSLSALKDVFQSLRLKNSFIPFRNSCLTLTLKSAFSGTGQVLLILNVSPAVEDAQETLCSLRFAADANDTQVTYS